MTSIDENKNSHRKIIMTYTQITCPNGIAHHVGKKGARPAEFGALAFVLEKSAAEFELGPRALKTLNSIEKIRPRMMVATFNGNHLLLQPYQC